MKKFIVFFIVFLIVTIIFVFGINLLVVYTTKNQIVKGSKYSITYQADCIVVLGAGVWNGSPSPMLEDRLKEGIDLYKHGVARKILMSGDHSTEEYDEVNVMKKYAIEHGIPSEDIFMDHAGVSTYDSIYRAKEIFNLKNIVIVTQEYHLYRALFIANQLGINALRCKR